MMKTAFAFAISLFLGGAVLAQGKVELKFAKPKVGDSARVTEVRDEKTDVLAIVNENEIKQYVVKSGTFTYVKTVLEMPDPNGKPTKTSRKYEKAEAKKDGKAVELSFVGKTVIIEIKDGDASYTVDGKPLPKDEVEWIDAETKKRAKEFDDVINPGKPVAVGDEWKFDATSFFNSEENLGFDEKNSTTTCKLTKVHQKNGKQYGTLELTMDLKIKSVNMNGNVCNTKDGSNMVMKGEVDCCIDGSEQAGEMKMKVEAVVNAILPMNGSMTVNSKVSGSKTMEMIKK